MNNLGDIPRQQNIDGTVCAKQGGPLSLLLHFKATLVTLLVCVAVWGASLIFALSTRSEERL